MSWRTAAVRAAACNGLAPLELERGISGAGFARGGQTGCWRWDFDRPCIGRAPICWRKHNPVPRRFVRNGAQDRCSPPRPRAAGDEATFLRRRLQIGGATVRDDCQTGLAQCSLVKNRARDSGWQQP
jgi:hypothetical protein